MLRIQCQRQNCRIEEDGCHRYSRTRCTSEPSSPPEPSQEPGDPSLRSLSQAPNRVLSQVQNPQKGLFLMTASTSNDPLIGNVVTILMALSNQWLDPVNAEILMLNSIDYVSPTSGPMSL